jgi:hypothetical protein
LSVPNSLNISIFFFNYVYSLIGGGGLSSLKVDKQGKTFAQMLLSFGVNVPSNWFSKL